jgi:hypothetical protein
MANDAWKKKDQKKIALERLCDACALYDKKRYLASFYMAGYVFEIGIKAVLIEFDETKLSNLQSKAIYEVFNLILPEDIGKDDSVKKALNKIHEFKPPTTVYDLRDYIVGLTRSWENVVRNASTGKIKTDVPFLSTLIENTPLYKLLQEGIQPPTSNGYHDMLELYDNVRKWGEILSTDDRRLQKINFFREEFQELKWSTDLRYSESIQNVKEGLNESEENLDKSKARKIIYLAMLFAKEILEKILNKECESSFSDEDEEYVSYKAKLNENEFSISSPQ